MPRKRAEQMNDEPNDEGQGADEGQEPTEEKAFRSQYFLVTQDRNMVTNRKGKVLQFSTRKSAIEIAEAFDFPTAILEVRVENFAWGE
jgi:hypothetical protein